MIKFRNIRKFSINYKINRQAKITFMIKIFNGIEEFEKSCDSHTAGKILNEKARDNKLYTYLLTDTKRQKVGKPLKKYRMTKYNPLLSDKNTSNILNQNLKFPEFMCCKHATKTSVW